MSSDSKNDLGFVVDEFSELRQSMKMFSTLCPAVENIFKFSKDTWKCPAVDE